MISTIVALGSSATKGFGVPTEHTWPAHLETLLHEHGKRIEVINRATHGLAVQALAERVLHLANTINPDFYLIQLPIPGRIYVGINGGSQLREMHLSKEVVLGWSQKSGGIHPTRLLLDPGVIAASSPFHHVIDKYYFPLIKRNNATVTGESFHSFLGFWHDVIARSDLELITYAKEVLLLQMLFASIGKPYLMLEWIGFRLQQRGGELGPFYSRIDFKHFVTGGEHTVYDYLKLKRPLDFQSLLHDEFGHLNDAGNRFVAEELILPAIRAAVDASSAN